MADSIISFRGSAGKKRSEMKLLLLLGLLWYNTELSTLAAKIPTSGKRHPNHDRDQDHLNVATRYSPDHRPVSAFEDLAFWNQVCQDDLAAQLTKTPQVSQARNVILFLGDGTSVATLTAARIHRGRKTGNNERQEMKWETFPYSSIIKTYNTDNMVTDSAASATAYLGGAKGNQATIGVDANVLVTDCIAMQNPAFHVHSILKNFQDAGRATGIVTTTRVTHASPAANYAHTAKRHWESDDDILDEYPTPGPGDPNPDMCDDITEQLVYGDTGYNINVVMGGGRKKFMNKDMIDPEGGTGGRRDDGKDLIQAWINTRSILGTAEYIWHRDELLTLDTAATDYLLGLFDYSHMAYAIDNDISNPSLAEMTRTAIEILQKNTNGFFLFVEGGLIDKAHHLNEARTAMEEALEFEDAIIMADLLTYPNDTLIIVTADHAQPITINGYPLRGSDVTGIAGNSDADNIPYTTMMYTNGPGYKGENNGDRPDPTNNNEYLNPHYAYAAAVPTIESFHSGEDVILYAQGPHSHLFTGIHENAYIPHALRYAACVGPGLQFCSANKND